MKKILFLLLILINCFEKETNQKILTEKEILQKNLIESKTKNKKLILVFGANWCIDCRILNQFLNEKEILEILNQNYILQKVDIGNFEKNLDLANELSRNLEELGIPNIIVFDTNQKILNPNIVEKIYSAKKINKESVKEFLLRYK